MTLVDLGRMAMSRFVLPILIAVGLSSPCFGADTPGLERLPWNVSSHSADFFERLLAGRVWVFNWRGAPAGIHFTHDHRAVGCWAGKSGGLFEHEPGFGLVEWWIGSPTNPTALQFTADRPGEKALSYETIVIYDPRTGRFHGERYSRDAEEWHVSGDGWIQDGFPAALRPLCAPLSLSPDLPVDQRQDSVDWNDVKRSAVPIRDFPGSEYSYIGATGLGASSGQATMTLLQVENYERLMNGVIGATPHEDGFVDRPVFVRTPDGNEVWLLDDHDDIVVVGAVTPVPGRDVNVIRWRGGGLPDYSYRIRFPIPVRPTSRRHPAFEMMAELAASERSIKLRHAGSKASAFVFLPEGKLRSPSGTGAWWISNGEIRMNVNNKVARYPWRDFADAAGWTALSSPDIEHAPVPGAPDER